MSVSGIDPSAQGDASAATREARSSALACVPLPAAGLPGHLVAGIASRVCRRLEPRFRWLQARDSNPRQADDSPLLLPPELACGGSRPASARHMRSQARRREGMPAGFSSPDRCREIEGAILLTARQSHRAESWFRHEAPKRRGPGWQQPTGASRGVFTGGRLHERALPEREGLARHAIQSRERVVFTPERGLRHEDQMRGFRSGNLVLVSHRGAQYTLNRGAVNTFRAEICGVSARGSLCSFRRSRAAGRRSTPRTGSQPQAAGGRRRKIAPFRWPIRSRRLQARHLNSRKR